MAFTQKPEARLYLRKLDVDGGADDLTLKALFNPTQLELDLKVAYQRQSIKGMSHQLLQYEATENQMIPLELYWRVWAQDTENVLRPVRASTATESFSVEDMRRAERFILSLCYPKRGASSVVGGAPPRVLVVWPSFASLVCVVTQAKFRFTRFDSKMRPIVGTASLALEEIRDARLTSEDAFDQGWRRPQGEL